MKLRWKLPVIVGFALVAGLLALRASAAGRTTAYYSFQRAWKAHWPLERGAGFPNRLRPAFEPFTLVQLSLGPGINMTLDPVDLVSRKILETGTWEPETWDAIERNLPAGGTFVDVGAHIGYYSLKASRVVGSGGHVVAIEPNPGTLTRIRVNIQSSDASNVMLEPVACSDAEGVLDLFAAGEANTGMSSLSEHNASGYGPTKAYHVRSRPLDDILKERAITHVDVIKIDVEGAEMLVLKGALETLAGSHPVLVIEVIDGQLRGMGTSAEELKAFLASKGYQEENALGANGVFRYKGL